MTAADDRRVPADVYQPFVISLYAGRALLHAGMISHAATGALIAFKTKDPFYLYCSIVIVLIWAIRMVHMRGFDLDEQRTRSHAEIAYWERCYIAAAGAVTLTLGTMCGYSLFVSRDAFAELAAISVTLGTLVSAVGRNYGSRRTVDVISAAATIPIVIGLLLLRDVYSTLLAGLIIPYVLTIRAMSKEVREFLYKNVMSRREISVIADRFNTALNNMPHGLFMLDENDRIIVANMKAAQLLHIGDWEHFRNHTIGAVLRFAVTRGQLQPEQSTVIHRQISALVKGTVSRALVRFSDELYLEFTARRRDKGVVLIFEDVTSRIKAEEKIIHMARYDSLTGLANRGYFAELVEGVVSDMAPEREIALAVFDIDDFKDINDTSGHMTGDKLLCALAARLNDAVGDYATISRFGGDEFVMFFHTVEDRSELEMRMTSILNVIRGSYYVNGNKVFVGISSGVVMSSASEFRLETMQIKADLALYASKQRGKNDWTLFAEEMDEDYSRRQRLKSDLRDAIANGGFSAAYQPMFSTHDMSIGCCEALARWMHPELGPISPGTFIELAEEMGIVGELTRQMLRVACRDCATWPGEVAVSVNLSGLDLRNRDVVGMVKEALRDSGLSPSRLMVEVTESAFVKDSSKAQAVLLELRAMGLTIAIDDFGTGYSSLSYLHVLPLNKVKIDRSFVANIATDDKQFKLLRGIVHLSRELGLDIVVEGVENEEQLELLRKTGGADLVQGFIFGFPMPAGPIHELISSRMAKPDSPPKKFVVGAR